MNQFLQTLDNVRQNILGNLYNKLKNGLSISNSDIEQRAQELKIDESEITSICQLKKTEYYNVAIFGRCKSESSSQYDEQYIKNFFDQYFSDQNKTIEYRLFYVSLEGVHPDTFKFNYADKSQLSKFLQEQNIDIIVFDQSSAVGTDSVNTTFMFFKTILQKLKQNSLIIFFSSANFYKLDYDEITPEKQRQTYESLIKNDNYDKMLVQVIINNEKNIKINLYVDHSTLNKEIYSAVREASNLSSFHLISTNGRLPDDNKVFEFIKFKTLLVSDLASSGHMKVNNQIKMFVQTHFAQINWPKSNYPIYIETINPSFKHQVQILRLIKK
jgi:hypothetical protein